MPTMPQLEVGTAVAHLMLWLLLPAQFLGRRGCVDAMIPNSAHELAAAGLNHSGESREAHPPALLRASTLMGRGKLLP